jgi:hypothetical protein
MLVKTSTFENDPRDVKIFFFKFYTSRTETKEGKERRNETSVRQLPDLWLAYMFVKQTYSCCANRNSPQ